MYHRNWSLYSYGGSIESSLVEALSKSILCLSDINIVYMCTPTIESLFESCVGLSDE